MDGQNVNDLYYKKYLNSQTSEIEPITITLKYAPVTPRSLDTQPKLFMQQGKYRDSAVNT